MNDKEWYEKKWIAHINELTGKTYYTVSDEQDKKEDITMSNKFTEEQYQEIIRTYDNNYGSEYKVMAVIRVVDDFNFDNNLSYNEAVAIANPVTREWAHEQFVEKEKKYVWRLKSANEWVVCKSSSHWYLDKVTNYKKHFSEKEIENSPFKPEWFDKEEVD